MPLHLTFIIVELFRLQGSLKASDDLFRPEPTTIFFSSLIKEILKQFVASGLLKVNLVTLASTNSLCLFYYQRYGDNSK